MKAVRFLTLTKKPFSSPSLQRLVPFSSSPAANPRFSNYFPDEAEGTSSVYRHALKFQRPVSIHSSELVKNSASFIGTVLYPIRVLNTEDGRFGVDTSLNVKTSSQWKESFRIRLCMWDELAKLSFQHLKPNDFIYVSGWLGSYAREDQNGDIRTYYSVTARELNYVTQRHDLTCKRDDGKQSDRGETGLEKYRTRLNLWQVFFANPDEWWDNRSKRNVNPRLPDFKHKDTGEALWQNSDDPPWIKKQLQLLDSKKAEQGQGERLRGSRISKWEYDE
ncbi:hypothetical protein FNV43_RR11407 [Rhamnella rubrinervis]|uniref:Uncharacterized protein n=1 Tax=Rhamnella rubrinervis TaxID=2594499 RepID=A0A8K0MHU4_9ROSA|nr:hypothetical protein FNV43_RR11407 [Rhamnella rubrinervis]